MRLRRVLVGVAYVAAVLLLGLGSAAVAIGRVNRSGAIQIGPWATSTTLGGEDAGMYERAAAAVHALFVLRRTETVYYRARKDDRGEPLSARCDYVIHGTPLQARWWSVTVYGDDDFLIPNEENRYSFNMKNLAMEPDGSFIVHASKTKQQGNWLPLGGRDGRISFTLRLYNPADAVAADPRTAALPSITGTCP